MKKPFGAETTFMIPFGQKPATKARHNNACYAQKRMQPRGTQFVVCEKFEASLLSMPWPFAVVCKP